MNADSKGLHAQQMTTREDVSRRSQAKTAPFQAAIQSAQAAGYSDWLAADEAALDYIATRIAPKFGVSGCRKFKCAEGATEISPGLVRRWPCASTYPGLTSQNIILPLLLERGEGRGKESKFVVLS